jgi:hypothetical protein
MANIALQDGKVVLKDGKASCTCCGGGCGCQTTPTAELIPILDAATTATCNGLPPTNWTSVSLPATPGWYAEWFYSNIFTLRWFSDTKCLLLSGDNAINIISSGTCLECDTIGIGNCHDQQYTINGISFPFYSPLYDPSFPITSPAFLF